MFVRVPYLCLVGLVLFVTLETVLSEEQNKKNPDNGAPFKRKLNGEEEEDIGIPDTSAMFKRTLWRRGKRVAFTAYLGNQKIKRNRQVIRYPHVTLNIGRAYRRGIFRAPSSGVYVFFFTSMPQRGKGDVLWLMKNGRRVVHSVSGRVSSAYNMGSNMAILYLRRGNKVWVQTSTTWKFSKIYKYQYSANSFSGFRLY